MTLLEFTNKLFAVGDNTTVYVCDDEPDEFGEEALREHIRKNGTLIMTHLSIMVLDYYCNERICNATVEQIYALGKDEFVVVVTLPEVRKQ